MKKSVAICALSFGISLSARTQDVTSLSNFDFIIKQFPFTVVMIQPMERSVEQRSLNNMFSLVARNDKYQDAGVRFIRISERQAWVQELLDKHNITNTPAFIIYDHGRIKKINLRPKVLYGYVNRAALTHFINSLIGAKVKEIIENNKLAAVWKCEQAKVNYQERPLIYYYPCPGYFYPYWWYICSPGNNRVSGCGSGWCF